MRADSPRPRCAGLLLVLALLSTGCASLRPLPGRQMSLRYTHGEDGAPAWAEVPGEESSSEPKGPQRLHRRQGSREAVTAVGPGSMEGTGSWGASGPVNGTG